MLRMLTVLLAASSSAAFKACPAVRAPTGAAFSRRRGYNALRMMQEVKGYFASTDVLLIERKEEDVSAFLEKERIRWDVVYEEELPAKYDQEFYPGDLVEIVADVQVQDIENAKGMRGVVTHYEFDDGYESCQTCSTSRPLTVLLRGDS